jgi:hypothetical protein
MSALDEIIDDADLAPDLVAALQTVAASRGELCFASFDDLKAFGEDMVKSVPHTEPQLRLAARKFVSYAISQANATAATRCVLEKAGRFVLDGPYKPTESAMAVATALFKDLNIPLESGAAQAPSADWKPSAALIAFEDMVSEKHKNWSWEMQLREFRVVPVHAKPVCLAVRDENRVVLVYEKNVDGGRGEVTLATVSKFKDDDRDAERKRTSMVVAPQPSDEFIDALKSRVRVKSWTPTDDWNPVLGHLEFHSEDDLITAKTILTRHGYHTNVFMY